MRRQARLFAIAEYLRARRTGVTAAMVAERFGVTLRTVYRDLDELRSGDLPLRAEQGRGGGYALDRHYSLPPVNFTAREAAVLVALGLHAVQMRTLPFTETMQAALDKVRGALSMSAQRELLELLPQLRFVGVPALTASPQVRRALEDAWFERRPVRVKYLRADGSVSVRDVQLASVVMERSETLLNVVDVQTGERRQYGLQKVVSLEPVPVESPPPVPARAMKPGRRRQRMRRQVASQ